MFNRAISLAKNGLHVVAATVGLLLTAPPLEAAIIGNNSACQRDVDAAVNEALRNTDCLGNVEVQNAIRDLRESTRVTAVVLCKRGEVNFSLTRPIGGSNSEIWWYTDTTLVFPGDTCTQDRTADLIHELLHAADRMRGRPAPGPPCPMGLPSSRERDTVRRENYLRRDKGVCQRHTYCGVRLSSDTYAANCFCCHCSAFQRPPLPPVCSDTPGCSYDESGPEGITPGPVCNNCPCGLQTGFPSSGSCNIHYPATAPACS